MNTGHEVLAEVKQDPVDLDKYTEVVKQIDDFFGNVAELPE